MFVNVCLVLLSVLSLSLSFLCGDLHKRLRRLEEKDLEG